MQVEIEEEKQGREKERSDENSTQGSRSSLDISTF